MQLDAFLYHDNGQPLQDVGEVARNIFFAAEALLSLRFLLKLFGMEGAGVVTNFIIEVTSPFSGFFSELFPPTEIFGVLFEWSTLVAMAGIYFFAYIFANMVLDQRKEKRIESVWP
jgi:hypothetical protein